MKKFIFLISIISILFLSIPSQSEEIKWVLMCDRYVYTNDSFTCGNHTIKNIQFSAPIKAVKDINGKLVTEYTIVPSVFFAISKDGNNEENILLYPQDNMYIDTNKYVKIEVSEFTDGNSLLWTFDQYSPRARIKYYFREKPNIDITLETDKSSYEMGTDSNLDLNITVKNTGSVVAHNVELTLSSTIDSNRPSFYFNDLNVGESKTVSTNFYIKNVRDNITISSISKAQDEQDYSKYFYSYKNLTVNLSQVDEKQRIFVTKYIRDRVYASDNVSVIISIGNSGSRDIYSIYVDDNLGDTLIPYSKTHWEYPTVHSGDQITITYNTVVNKIGHFTIPETTVKYDYKGQPQTIKSNTVTIDTIDVPSNYRKKLPEGYQVMPTVTQTITSAQTTIPIATPIETQAVVIITPAPVQNTVVPIVPPPLTPSPNKYYNISELGITFLIATILFSYKIIKG